MKYEGGDAKQHVLDMRQLGESLIGIERLINTGLYVLEHGERPGHGLARISHQLTAADADLPVFAALNAVRVLDVLSSTPARPNSRSPCEISHLHALASQSGEKCGLVLKSVIRVSTPQPGSLEFIPDLLAGVYPLLNESIVQKHIGGILRQLVKIPLLAMGGLEHEAQGRTHDLLEKALATSERAAERTDMADERRHREQMKVYELLSHQWAYEAARNAVSPVGKGCDCMQISDCETSDTITPMMARAIRSRGSVKMGEPRELSVLVDGFIHRTRQLRVVHPDVPDRLVTAYVRDPAFDVAPNIYTEAASSKKNASECLHVTSARATGWLRWRS